MASAAGPSGWSPSVNTALLWASGCASLRPGGAEVQTEELFVGMLLAHPDKDGEVWRLLDHFGLTLRDLLPDDYPILDTAVLREAAAAAHDPSPDEWNIEVATIMSAATQRAGGPAQVLHVLAALLMVDEWQDRLQVGVDRFGISARTVADELNTDGVRQIDLRSMQTAGVQLGDWLARRFPRRPVTMASFSNDVPDPGADFVGVSKEADAFAYLIASRTLVPPLAIGLFGDWGSGKSFLMAKIRQRVGQLTAMAAGDSIADGIWPKVVPIEFNAWQYVETDLWAALLSRIFDELSPEARSKLTALRAKKDENLRRQLRAEQLIARLSESERKGVEAVAEAVEETNHVKERVATIRDTAVRAALEAHARSAATAGVLGAIGKTLGPEVADVLTEAQEARVAAQEPVWRQSRFWTLRRTVWIVGALLAASALVLVLDSFVTFAPAFVAALGTGAAILTPMLRSAASFAQEQQRVADEATTTAIEQLSALVQNAEKAQAQKEHSLATTRSRIVAAQENARHLANERIDLDKMAERLKAGAAYADFLRGRGTAEDYRKRLGVVSTVSDDLAALSELIAAYNREPEALDPDGPPNRIVLYIDDLDRCPPARVLEVLEAVHLLLAFPLFVVVVAVDTRWLTTALHEALPLLQRTARPGVARPTATDYLEKIFQIPFWVEPLDDAARHRLLRGLLLPSVEVSDGARPQQTGTAVRVGKREREPPSRCLLCTARGSTWTHVVSPSRPQNSRSSSP